MVLLEKRSHRLVHFGRKGGAQKVVEIHATFHWAKVAAEREVFNAGVGRLLRNPRGARGEATLPAAPHEFVPCTEGWFSVGLAALWEFYRAKQA